MISAALGIIWWFWTFLNCFPRVCLKRFCVCMLLLFDCYLLVFVCWIELLWWIFLWQDWQVERCPFAQFVQDWTKFGFASASPIHRWYLRDQFRGESKMYGGGWPKTLGWQSHLFFFGWNEWSSTKLYEASAGSRTAPAQTFHRKKARREQWPPATPWWNHQR